MARFLLYKFYLMAPKPLVPIVSVGLFALLSFIPSAHAQMRTKTKPPYPTVAKSVSWIVNVPYIEGGGPEQQLDLYIPTDRHGEPLVVFIHGGGFQHGDKAGDSINPNNLQWLWQGTPWLQSIIVCCNMHSGPRKLRIVRRYPLAEGAR